MLPGNQPGGEGVTRHAFLDSWDGWSGLCFHAKRFDLKQDQVNGRFVGRIYLCGPGKLCGHCQRALAQQARDIFAFLDELEGEA